MPIYEYRCGACGFQKEFLQRLNEKPLTVCPECGKRSFNKMVTAAGFQLTDFWGGAKSTTASDSSETKAADTKSDKPASADKPAAKDSSKKKGDSAAKASAASTTDSSN
jgi:putative FmdB family regulatory protein